MSKPKLVISFSGGRTSAVMTKLCLEKYGDSHEILVTFANTDLDLGSACGESCEIGADDY